MSDDAQELAETQRQHWQHTYTAHPGMYGEKPSAPAVQGVAELVTTVVHDVRDPLPLADACVDAVFAHMLLCMALSTEEIHALVGEVRRVLRPGGVLVYTVRHTDDAHYGAGIAHGDDIFEHDGFAVHFFPRRLVDALADGWNLAEGRCTRSEADRDRGVAVARGADGCLTLGARGVAPVEFLSSLRCCCPWLSLVTSVLIEISQRNPTEGSAMSLTECPDAPPPGATRCDCLPDRAPRL
ncbi:methyltransferase domain-containing protein [Streptomyces sp. NPDC058457]|uniref:methyltransferase domain-containing protein n=1 Tax=Streptomyces sp. NPDC058457 TaxID=3346507 RepID=UPI00364CD69F